MPISSLVSLCIYDDGDGVDVTNTMVDIDDGASFVRYAADFTPANFMTSVNHAACISGPDGANPHGVLVTIFPFAYFPHDALVVVTSSYGDLAGNLAGANWTFTTESAPPPVCTDGHFDTYALEGATCGPVDCDDTNASVHPGATEDCTNGIDDDCDGLVDGADPDAVGCPPTCTDADAADTDCGGDTEPPPPGEAEICDDGIDNDGDGKVDCADNKDCGKDPAC